MGAFFNGSANALAIGYIHASPIYRVIVVVRLLKMVISGIQLRVMIVALGMTFSLPSKITSARRFELRLVLRKCEV